MGYEYIEELQSEMNNLTKHGSVSFKAIDELNEIYRKAKAFDRIAEVHSDNDHYSDEYVLETIQEQIDELERADDER